MVTALPGQPQDGNFMAGDRSGTRARRLCSWRSTGLRLGRPEQLFR